MRKEASFRTSGFNTSEVRDYFTNDGCFGDDLANWIMDRLRSAGIETGTEPGQEDDGWYFEFTVGSREGGVLVQGVRERLVREHLL
jgi:hypothetical protein